MLCYAINAKVAEQPLRLDSFQYFRQQSGCTLHRITYIHGHPRALFHVGKSWFARQDSTTVQKHGDAKVQYILGRYSTTCRESCPLRRIRNQIAYTRCSITLVPSDFPTRRRGEFSELRPTESYTRQNVIVRLSVSSIRSCA